MIDYESQIKNIVRSSVEIPEDFDYIIDNILLKLPKRQTKENNSIRNLFIKIVSFIIASISITAVATYVGTTVNNKKETSKINQKESVNSISYDETGIKLYKDDQFSVPYKIIKNADEYNKFSNLYDNMPSVDFEKEFLMVFYLGESGVDGIKLFDITSDDETMYVSFGNEELDYENTYLFHHYDVNDVYDKNCLAISVSNELYRENLKINLLPGSEAISKYGFTLMKDITNDYINETAKEENCLILDGENKLLYRSESDFINFIENCNNNINGAFRIIKKNQFPDLDDWVFEVRDIIYENGKYHYFSTCYKSDDAEEKYKWTWMESEEIGTKITKYKYMDNDDYIEYYLESDDKPMKRKIVMFSHNNIEK